MRKIILNKKRTLNINCNNSKINSFTKSLVKVGGTVVTPTTKSLGTAVTITNEVQYVLTLK